MPAGFVTPAPLGRIVCDVRLLNLSVIIWAALFLYGYRLSQVSVLQFVKSVSLIMHKDWTRVSVPHVRLRVFSATC